MSVVLVTGASRGLGAELVAHLRRVGHVVYGTSRTAVAGDARHLTLDVTSAAACQRVVDEVFAREGRLDVLINNAGSHLFGAALETSDEELRAQLELNFHGAVHMIQAVAPRLVEQRVGKIINVSSIGGRLATPFAAAYCASKFALEGYTEALRLELLPLGVFVSNLEPGFLATGTTAQSVTQVAQAHPLFESARRAAHAQMMKEGAQGTPLSVVNRTVDGILASRRPRLRYSVDGLLTRLEALRAVSSGAFFERMVTRQMGTG